MKITLNSYIIKSILKTTIIAVLVFSLILAGVELFQRMDSIITGGVPFIDVFAYALLCIPQYFLMVLSISLLFASTYFQSTLSANNERIALLNAGISKWKLFLPIFLLALVMTLFGFVINESALKALESARVRKAEELFGAESTQDSRNIVLKTDNGYVIYTSRYVDYDERIVSPIVVKEVDGELEKRVTAFSGNYTGGCWTMNNATVYSRDENGKFNVEHYSSLTLDDLTVEPDYFKAENINVETMSIPRALEYLSRLKTTQREAWQEKATDYLRTLFAPLSILLLLSISAAFDYNIKKNVLLFAVVESLCVAVVYYVSDMVFSIFAHQGAFPPIMAVVLPVVSTLAIAVIINEGGKRV